MSSLLDRITFSLAAHRSIVSTKRVLRNEMEGLEKEVESFDHRALVGLADLSLFWMMELSALRKEIHEYVDKADDRILRLVRGMFQADSNDYTMPGEPMSTEELGNRVRAAKSRIESGEYTSQEDLESEIEEW